MPISSERKSGFGLSKWEANYLRCRYKAHRNKIAAMATAIDAEPPSFRSHVHFKKKKALTEETRRVGIMQENLRILNRTAEIMGTTFTFDGPSGDRQSLTSAIRKNFNVIFQWFMRRMGHYTPWWAHIKY